MAGSLGPSCTKKVFVGEVASPILTTHLLLPSNARTLWQIDKVALSPEPRSLARCKWWKDFSVQTTESPLLKITLVGRELTSICFAWSCPTLVTFRIAGKGLASLRNDATFALRIGRNSYIDIALTPLTTTTKLATTRSSFHTVDQPHRSGCVAACCVAVTCGTGNLAVTGGGRDATTRLGLCRGFPCCFLPTLCSL